MKLQQTFHTMQIEFDSFLKNFLLQQAFDALAKTKENTPVNLSQLRSAWTISSVERHGNTLEVMIHNPLNYVSSMEFGYLSSDHTRWVDGKFMCTLALDEIERVIPQRFRAAFQNWVKGV